MNPSRHIIFALALSFAAGGAFLACGGDEDTGDKGGDKGGDDDDDDGPGNGGLTLVYNPMYSAYEPTHTYQVPVVIEPAGLATWTSDPAGAVEFQATDQGALITVKQAGKIKIKAKLGDQTGEALLDVQEATPELWEIGQKRYTAPNPAIQSSDAGGAGGNPFGLNINPNASCTNCHGETSDLKVEHTPQQAGGYSPEELIKVFTEAKKPEGAPQRVTNIPAVAWQQFHKWNMTDEEKQGIIVYLRSLPPKPTVTSVDFMGIINRLRDSGVIDFSRFRRDGGSSRSDAGGGNNNGGNNGGDAGVVSPDGIDSGT